MQGNQNNAIQAYTLAFESLQSLRRDLFANLNPFISSPEPLHPHQQFYDWLIRPAQAELERSGIKTLVFVLDGVFRGLPMAALHDGQQYLLEKYNIALTPGLQLLNPRSRLRCNVCCMEWLEGESAIAYSIFTITRRILLMALAQDLAQPPANTPAQPQVKNIGFLREDNGKYSTIRLMSFIALIAAIAFGSYTITHQEIKDSGINITFSFLVAAFAPKAVQRFAERPSN